MKDDGGRAFPRPQVVGEHPYGNDYNHPNVAAHEGMSLRDYFAAKAMAALIECRYHPSHPVPKTGIAEEAYELADAMLAERAK